MNWRKLLLELALEFVTKILSLLPKQAGPDGTDPVTAKVAEACDCLKAACDCCGE